MKTYAIDSENNITAHAGTPVDAADSFTSEKELAALAAGWPMSRLVETWKRLAGVAPFADLKPVKKFENRAVAVARIWTAASRLTPDLAKPAANLAPGAAVEDLVHRVDNALAVLGDARPAKSAKPLTGDLL